MDKFNTNGVVTERISPSVRDWEAFRRKISAGHLPEIAAEECGIPWAEAEESLKQSRTGAELDDDALRYLAARAMTKAVETLESLAAMPQGRVSSSSLGPGMIESTTYDDLHAAKALLDGALKLRRLLQVGKKKAEEARGRDLFDLPPRQSPWTFRKSD